MSKVPYPYEVNGILITGNGSLDTGHFFQFPYKPDPMPTFQAYFKVKNPQFESFLRASEVLGGASEAGKKK